jgi:hypothetical protein
MANGNPPDSITPELALGVKTGGRQKGTKNKRSIARAMVDEEAILNGITPLEYMLNVLRDATQDVARRDEMARAAAPYCHSRLATTEMKVEQHPLSNKTSQELRLELVQHLVEWGYLRPEVLEVGPAGGAAHEFADPAKH